MYEEICVSGKNGTRKILLSRRTFSHSLLELVQALGKGELEEESKKKLPAFAENILADIAAAGYSKGDVAAESYISARLHEALFLFCLSGAPERTISGEVGLLMSYCDKSEKPELRDYISSIVWKAAENIYHIFEGREVEFYEEGKTGVCVPRHLSIGKYTLADAA